MRVENGNGAGSASGMGAIMSSCLLGQNEDAQSKSIRKQIETKQQELSELSAKEDMSPEEKMKRRQELTKEISDLNMQLRQHQMEQRMQEKAEQQKKQGAQNARNTGMQGAKRGGKKGDAQAAGFSAEGMTAMLSADASMNQAQVQGSVSNKMENRAHVLESEIKLDSARGGSTEGKQAELAAVEGKAVSAAVAQAGSLKDVNESVREAAEAERSNTAEHAETEHSEKKKDAKGADQTDSKKVDSAKENDTDTTVSGQEKDRRAQSENGGAGFERERSQSELYPPVDVRV